MPKQVSEKPTQHWAILRRASAWRLFALAWLAVSFFTATAPLAQSGSSAWQESGDATAPIHTEGWTKPENGWFYVLDSRPIARAHGGRIWLVDPKARKVMGSVVTGDAPDFALSPDGSRLYVAARGEEQSNLAVIDTSNGTILGTQTIENRVMPSGAPPYSTMEVSADGSTLRVLVNADTSSGGQGFQLASYDTQSGSLLAGHIHLGNCGYGRFIGEEHSGQFDFLCPTTNYLRRIRVDSNAKELDNSYVAFPWERRLGIAQIVFSSDSKQAFIARGDGAIFTMDIASANFAPTREKSDIQGRQLPASWPTSPDGGRLFYVGYSRNPNKRFYLDFDRSATDAPRTQTVDELRVFETTSWHKVGSIKTREPFWAAAVAADGTLFLTSPESHSVLVVDPVKMRQIGSIPVGGSPALILFAP